MSRDQTDVEKLYRAEPAFMEPTDLEEAMKILDLAFTKVCNQQKSGSGCPEQYIAKSIACIKSSNMSAFSKILLIDSAIEWVTKQIESGRHSNLIISYLIAEIMDRNINITE